MNRVHRLQPVPPPTRVAGRAGRRAAARSLSGRVAALALAALLGACGADTDLLAGVGSGGTGAAAFGPITGFGSVIVNGVRYEDGGADIRDDAGRSRSAADLALGMMVEVRGRIADSGLEGRADAITIVSELRGPVDAGSIDLAAGRFSVLGIAVSTGADTVFDDPAGLGGLAAGSRVEVYGVADRTAGMVRATRIEREPGLDPAVLRGRARSVTASSFVIGPPAQPLLVELGSAQLEPAGALPANGRMVRIETGGEPLGGVLRLGAADRVRIEDPWADLDAGTRLELEGLIEAVSAPDRFTLVGVPVDASGARLDEGSAGDLAIGARVEVEGVFRAGTLVASRIEFAGGSGSGLPGGPGGPGDDTKFEVSGPIGSLAGPGRFTVRGVAIDASGAAVEFDRGTLADLQPGRRVEVRGSIRGDTLVAARVEFDD